MTPRHLIALHELCHVLGANVAMAKAHGSAGALVHLHLDDVQGEFSASHPAGESARDFVMRYASAGPLALLGTTVAEIAAALAAGRHREELSDEDMHWCAQLHAHEQLNCAAAVRLALDHFGEARTLQLIEILSGEDMEAYNPLLPADVFLPATLAGKFAHAGSKAARPFYAEIEKALA